MIDNIVDENINGVLLVNKPVDISSNKVVNIVKYKLKAKKCGHLGTLDLEGAGLLPVTINKGTKLFDFFLEKDKTYETVFVFGFETDTLDTTGKIVKQKDCSVCASDVESVAKSMIGKQLQMPPLYSAKKVNGKVAYKEARKGNTVELQPKEIEIFDFKLIEILKENVFKFEITCSSGTYIRSICRDLAYKLSTYGSMQSIIRTRCGIFNLKEAFTLDDIENDKFQVISCAEVFDNEKISLGVENATKLLNGQTINFKGKDGQYKLFFEKTFLGLGELNSEELKFKLRLI